MSNYLASNTDLESVANAIRTKGGTSAQLAFPNGFVSAIDAIPTGGTLITKNITANGTYSAEDDDADGYSEVTVNVSGGTVATGDQFVQRYISTERFDVYDTFNVDAIKPTNPIVERYALSTNAEIVCFWNMTGSSGQYGAQYALRGIRPRILVIPKITRLSVNIIQCANLEIIDANKPRFDMGSLSGTTTLHTIILRGDSVPTLSATDAFNSTCFASGKTGGTLYVPQALISSYQSASNWSTILGYANNQIKSIESTHTDPTAPIDLTLYYADGTPISA